MKNHEAHNGGPFPFVDFSDKTRGETVVVEQAIVAVNRPVRQVIPGSFDVNDSIDIALSNFTSYDRQCFHARSPHPFCAHKVVPMGRCSLFRRARRPSMQCRGPWDEPSTQTSLQSPSDTELLHPRKIPAAEMVKVRTTR